MKNEIYSVKLYGKKWVSSTELIINGILCRVRRKTSTQSIILTCSPVTSKDHECHIPRAVYAGPECSSSSLKPGVSRWINDNKPMVTNCHWHHCPLTSSKLHCLVTGAHACQQLAQSLYLTKKTAAWPGVERATSTLHVQCIKHCITRPQGCEGYMSVVVSHHRQDATWYVSKQWRWWLCCCHFVEVLPSSSLG